MHPLKNKNGFSDSYKVIYVLSVSFTSVILLSTVRKSVDSIMLCWEVAGCIRFILLGKAWSVENAVNWFAVKPLTESERGATLIVDVLGLARQDVA